MTTQAWLMYLALVIVATATPGPAVLFITTNSALHGVRKAVFAALGNIVGLFCLGGIAVTGLGTILQASELVFNVVRYAGAVYLIYLGLKLVFRQNAELIASENRSIAGDISSRKIFFQALAVALSNPKAIVFLTALFPQFIDVNESLPTQFCLLIATLMFFSFAFLMLYAFLAQKAKKWLKKTAGMNGLSKTSGAIFIAFGVLLATSSHS
jgi:threonine/homoserine/homoserine lactone efflux protein